VRHTQRTGIPRLKQNPIPARARPNPILFSLLESASEWFQEKDRIN